VIVAFATQLREQLPVECGVQYLAIPRHERDQFLAVWTSRSGPYPEQRMTVARAHDRTNWIAEVNDARRKPVVPRGSHERVQGARLIRPMANQATESREQAGLDGVLAAMKTRRSNGPEEIHQRADQLDELRIPSLVRIGELREPRRGEARIVINRSRPNYENAPVTGRPSSHRKLRREFIPMKRSNSWRSLAAHQRRAWLWSAALTRIRSGKPLTRP
jgi:hypothetical protein